MGVLTTFQHYVVRMCLEVQLLVFVAYRFMMIVKQNVMVGKQFYVQIENILILILVNVIGRKEEPENGFFAPLAMLSVVIVGAAKTMIVEHRKELQYSMQFNVVLCYIHNYLIIQLQKTPLKVTLSDVFCSMQNAIIVYLDNKIETKNTFIFPRYIS